ncbi:MAG: hypothetical protein U0350_40540 [Caldilineaceae bacterium]
MAESPELIHSAAVERSAKTQWHHLLGRLLELLLTPVGITVQTELQVMSEPPKVDILLLRRKGAVWTPAQARLLPDGVQHSRARHILLEFKFTESVNRAALTQALAYDYFYRQTQQVAEADVQTFVISAHTVRKNVLAEYGYAVTEHPGVYRSSNPLLRTVPLLLLNELQATQHNAFIQCFASKRRVRTHAFQLLAQLDWQMVNEAFWDFVAGLRNYLEVKGAEMSNVTLPSGLTPEMVMETGKAMRKALLENLTPQEIQQLLTKLTPEQRLAGLTPEEGQRLLEQLQVYLQTQQPKRSSSTEN